MINRFLDTHEHDHPGVSYDATDAFPMSLDSTPPSPPATARPGHRAGGPASTRSPSDPRIRAVALRPAAPNHSGPGSWRAASAGPAPNSSATATSERRKPA